jgi:hypothetical protein
LRQLQLEFRVAADAERTAETVDRRFADRGGLGEGGDAEAGGLLRVEQDDLGDFAFGLVQLFEAILDLFQKFRTRSIESFLGSPMPISGGNAGPLEWPLRWPILLMV